MVVKLPINRIVRLIDVLEVERVTSTEVGIRLVFEHDSNVGYATELMNKRDQQRQQVENYGRDNCGPWM